MNTRKNDKEYDNNWKKKCSKNNRFYFIIEIITPVIDLRSQNEKIKRSAKLYELLSGLFDQKNIWSEIWHNCCELHDIAKVSMHSANLVVC